MSKHNTSLAVPVATSLVLYDLTASLMTVTMYQLPSSTPTTLVVPEPLGGSKEAAISAPSLRNMTSLRYQFFIDTFLVLGCAN